MHFSQAVSVLIHNLILSPGPLYRLGEWVEAVEAHTMGLTDSQKKVINDDRVARALDAVASERGRSIFFRLALRLIKQFNLATDRIHHDTTTVTFSGAYASSVTTPRITLGHNKDHRPDLKQLVFGLNITADGAVPLLHSVYSGNKTDDSVHLSNVESLRQILGKDDFIYVADCKLCTAQNMSAIDGHGGKFVTVLPRSRMEDRQFRKNLRDRPARWKTILTVPNKRTKSGPPDIYASCSGPSDTKEGYRLIWIRSSQKAAQDATSREERIRRAELALRDLTPRLNSRNLKTRSQIRKKVNAILKENRVQQWLQVTLHQYDEVRTKYLRRGRPSPDSPVRSLTVKRLRIKVKRNIEALKKEARTDGVFPLVTNLTKGKRFGKKAVLLIYKYQPYIEKRFSQLKTEHEVAPVYLKKPRRVAGLIHVYFIVLAATALIERQVRQGMVRAGIEELPILPEGRMTKTPTAARILEAFSDVKWYEFEGADESVMFPVELSPIQRNLLRLLEVPQAAYE